MPCLAVLFFTGAVACAATIFPVILDHILFTTTFCWRTVNRFAKEENLAQDAGWDVVPVLSMFHMRSRGWDSSCHQHSVPACCRYSNVPNNSRLPPPNRPLDHALMVKDVFRICSSMNIDIKRRRLYLADELPSRHAACVLPAATPANMRCARTPASS